MQQTQQQSYPGIIDTISAGFGMVTRRLVLLLIPLFVDLVLALAPPLTFGPLLGQAVEGYQGFLQQAAANPASGITGDQVKEIESQVQGVREQITGLNLLDVMAWRVPSLLKVMDTPAGGQQSVQVTTWGGLLLTSLGLVVGGLLLSALYLGALAQYVRHGSFKLARYLVALGRQWRRLVAFTLILLAGALVIGVPALAVAGLLARFVPPLAAFVMTALLAVVVWAAVYLYFVDSAIFMADVSALQAIRQSFFLVRRHFWSALGLILLSVIIGFGTGIVWTRVVPGSFPWVILAMIGNSYIATGLIAASFIYYRDRSAQAAPTPATSGGS